MSPALIQCPNCRTALVDGGFNRGEFTPCPACAASLQIEIFPALFRRLAGGQTGELVLAEGEASCFFHPQKRAVLPCAGCGRFLCALCDCEHLGRHWCPACLEAGRTKGRIKSLESSRTRYDQLALAFALWPMLIFYFTLLTAPLVLYLVIRHWNSPRGLTQRSRVRFVVAGVIALLQLLGWAVLLITLFAG